MKENSHKVRHTCFTGDFFIPLWPGCISSRKGCTNLDEPPEVKVVEMPFHIDTMPREREREKKICIYIYIYIHKLED